MKKFLLTFIALGLISSLSCLPSEVQRTRLENQRFFDIVGAITKLVNSLIQTVQNKLNDLVNQTGAIILQGIENIEKAITDAITDFSDQIKNVQEQLNALVNETVKPCLDGLNGEIIGVQNETLTNIALCYETGRTELDKISEYIANYTAKNNQEFQSVRDKIQECIAEPDFGDKIKCAVDASNTIRDAVINYAQNIDDTAKGIFSTITNSVNGTFVCIQNESDLGEDKLNEIVDHVTTCLSQEETTEEGTTTTESTTVENTSTTTEDLDTSTTELPTTSELTTTTEELTTTSTRELTTSTTEEPPTSGDGEGKK